MRERESQKEKESSRESERESERGERERLFNFTKSEPQRESA